MKITIKEIEDIEHKLIDGIKNSAVEFLDTILHDDLLFIAPNGQLVTKQADLASHKAGSIKVEQLISNIEEVRIIGDTAVVVIVYDTKGTMMGNPIEGKFRYIRIWKRFGMGLKVIGGSCFQISGI